MSSLTIKKDIEGYKVVLENHTLTITIKLRKFVSELSDTEKVGEWMNDPHEDSIDERFTRIIVTLNNGETVELERYSDEPRWRLMARFEYPEWDDFDSLKKLDVYKYLDYNLSMRKLNKHMIREYGTINGFKFVPYEKVEIRDRKRGDGGLQVSNGPKLYTLIQSSNKKLVNTDLFDESKFNFHYQNEKCRRVSKLCHVDLKDAISLKYNSISYHFFFYATSLYYGWRVLNWKKCAFHATRLEIDWSTGVVSIYQDRLNKAIGDSVYNGETLFVLREVELKNMYNGVEITSVILDKEKL